MLDWCVSRSRIFYVIVSALKKLPCKSGPWFYKEIDARIFALTPRSDGEGMALEGGLETNGRNLDPDVNILTGLDGPRRRKENRHSNNVLGET